ncbi:glycosyltransferase family 2 protein [Sphingobacterium kitahiroshimense]|uniref:Glycosyltransferase family 2 protein n=1 Tax=Sphingobacterium kitahiroshimense TaxID=470446 RepID=A0ABV0BVY3_9SPHI
MHQSLDRHQYRDRNLPKVSIIVPVHNAQQTLERTLTSLRNQTYGHIEFIFIDNGSTDYSLIFLEQFAISIIKVIAFTSKIILLKQYEGVAYARNKALNHATGEFVMHLEPGHSMDNDAVATCVQHALDNDADVVYFHWCLKHSNIERIMRQPLCTTPLEVIQAILSGRMRWDLWLFMVRRRLYVANRILFTTNIALGADIVVTTKLLVHARNVSLLDRPVYHYRYDKNIPLSVRYSPDHFEDIETALTDLEEYLMRSPYAGELGRGLDFLKLNVKLPLLVTGERADYKKWSAWFKSSNRYILSNSTIPFSTRALQWFAWKRQYWAIWVVRRTGVVRGLYHKK